MRVAVKLDPYFRAMYCSELEEIPGLALDVYYADNPTVVETLTPVPSVEAPGLQSAPVTFENTGTYRLHWRATDPAFSVWDEVNVIPSADVPYTAVSTFAVGSPWYGVLPAGTHAAPIYAEVRAPDMGVVTHDVAGTGVLSQDTPDQWPIRLTVNSLNFAEHGVCVGDVVALDPAVAGTVYAQSVSPTVLVLMCDDAPTPTMGSTDFTVTASAYGATAAAPNFRFTDPMVPRTAGGYLIRWYEGGEPDITRYIGYTTQDFFFSSDLRPVTIALRNPQGQPLLGVHVTLTSDGGTWSVTRLTDAGGMAYYQVSQGGYYVTLTDTAHPDRVFDTNNMAITVTGTLEGEPVYDLQGNLVPQMPDNPVWVYTVSWLDLPSPVVPTLVVPSANRAWMHVAVAAGPSGVPTQFRKFTVELLTPVRLDNGFIVMAGSSVYSLDSAGLASVPLVRGSRVRVSFSQAPLALTFNVPSQADFNLVDMESSDPFGVTLPKVFYPLRMSP